ncbi:MAG: hypothetical protein ABTB30_02710, partial [Clostridia bacterium]
MKTRVLILTAAAILLTAALCCLPFLQYSSQMYIKRSPNTFVGDEKYTAARAEVEAQLETYRAQGIDCAIDEQVTERVNSKKEKTSLVIFTINAANTRSGWDLLAAGLPSSRLLIAALGAGMAAWILTMLNIGRKSGGHAGKTVGIFSFIFALAFFFLVPTVYLRMNLDLSRTVSLYANGQEVPGIDGLLGALNRFLFDGEAGDSLVTMLTAMDYSSLPALFLLLVPAGGTICAAILGCRKNLKKTLGR